MNTKFKEFLECEKCYDEYVEARIQWLDINKTYCTKDDPLHLGLIHPDNLIEEVFTWSKTKQGYSFWNTLNNKWLGVLYPPKKSKARINKT